MTVMIVILMMTEDKNGPVTVLPFFAHLFGMNLCFLSYPTLQFLYHFSHADLFKVSLCDDECR